MQERSGDVGRSTRARPPRLVLPCREPSDVARAEHVAFAFARDAGLRGVDAWYPASGAAMLAAHLVSRGGDGELELRVVAAPRPALELIATDEGAPLEGFSPELVAARGYASELRVSWHAAAGSIVTARFWIRV
jgi:hypothetical protein